MLRSDRPTSLPDGVSPAAVTACLRLLRSRDLLPSEMRAKLLERGFAEGETDPALAWVCHVLGIRQDRLAESLADQHRRHGWGPEAVRAKLLAKGVDPDLADELAASTEEDSRTAVERWLEKRPALASDPGKLARFLASKGFEEDVIRWALEAYAGVED